MEARLKKLILSDEHTPFTKNAEYMQWGHYRGIDGKNGGIEPD